METRASHFTVGVFVLAVLIGLSIFVVWLGHESFSHHGKRYRLYFTHSVTGVQPGAPVRLAGVPVGSVKSIGIDPTNSARVEVAIEVAPDTPVKTDTTARTEMEGVTGNSVIELEHGTEASLSLPSSDSDSRADWPVIATETSSSGNLLEALPRLIDKLSTLIDRLQALASEKNTTNFSEALVHLNHFSASLDGMTPKLSRTVDHADAMVEDLRTKLPALTGEANATLHSVHAASDNLNSVLSAERGPLHELTTDGVYKVTEVLGDLSTLTHTLTRVADRLEQNPNELLFGNDHGGVPAR